MVLRYEQLPQKVLWYLQVASEPDILRVDGNGDLPLLITRDSCNRFRHGSFCSHDKTAYMLRPSTDKNRPFRGIFAHHENDKVAQ